MSFGKISTDDPAKKPRSGCAVGCASVIVVAVLIGVAVSIFGGSSSREPDDDLSAVMAERACERAVESRLKAPSTADFVNTDAVGSGTSWKVSGQVEAENSFGATIRNSFTCDVTVVDESATVDAVNIR